MMWLNLLALAITFIQSTQAQEGRIIGGNLTTIDKVPYLVSIRRDGAFKCGGSLIAPNFVVTSAKCVKGFSYDRLIVTGGNSALARLDGERRNVIKVILPYGYNNITNDWEVAVLKLDTDMVGANIKPIDLCDAPLKMNQKGLISGWGFTSEGGKGSNVVRSVEIPLISKAACVQAYKGKAEITLNMVCAYEAGKDVCNGDYGGPLVIADKLCGIASWGDGCAKTLPGVYANVNIVKDFIEKAKKL